jgi:hypothetical protein
VTEKTKRRKILASNHTWPRPSGPAAHARPRSHRGGLREAPSHTRTVSKTAGVGAMPIRRRRGGRRMRRRAGPRRPAAFISPSSGESLFWKGNRQTKTCWTQTLLDETLLDAMVLKQIPYSQMESDIVINKILVYFRKKYARRRAPPRVLGLHPGGAGGEAHRPHPRSVPTSINAMHRSAPLL